MSSLMKKLCLAIIQQFWNDNRYSSDSERSGVSSMYVEPESSLGPFRDLEEVIKQEFLSLRNPTNERDLPDHARQCR
ncbi:hypothetical protein AX774_g2560 [Zancudomyces culisetae]|uniref:Uncharacterized protein n=1 Tax=Zancudomyces culisetae TaxID=1213189 RepID=A0A1R1PSG2_ZANCU|nr:hypothetical protein AX774_g2560 [Zancudomyces culisetae]|eukprot:OMH83926.1 hypothetical protein AX774_g2560 [Zancudomyces culisetae]